MINRGKPWTIINNSWSNLVNHGQFITHGQTLSKVNILNLDDHVQQYVNYLLMSLCIHQQHWQCVHCNEHIVDHDSCSSHCDIFCCSTYCDIICVKQCETTNDVMMWEIFSHCDIICSISHCSSQVMSQCVEQQMTS